MLESEDAREALEGFQEVLKMEQEKGEWCEPRGFGKSNKNRQ
jgi:hypothetical protein